MQRPTTLLVCFCIVLAGCDSGAMQSENSDPILQLNAVADVSKRTPIPVGPAIQRDSSQAVALTVDAEARAQPVSVKRFVVAFKSTASISKILSGAQLLVSGKAYKLSRVDSTRRGTSGFFVFDSAGRLFTADNDSRRLRVMVDPKPSANGKKLQLNIGSAAIKQMEVTTVSEKVQLTADDISGPVRGAQHTFKRAGAYVDVVADTAEIAGETARIIMRLEVSTFAVDIAIPWLSHQLEGIDNNSQRGGVFYAVTNNNGRLLKSAVQSAVLEFTSTVASDQTPFTDNQLELKDGQSQRLSLSVRVGSGHNVRKACLRLAKIVYRSESTERLHAAPGTLKVTCADF